MLRPQQTRHRRSAVLVPSTPTPHGLRTVRARTPLARVRTDGPGRLRRWRPGKLDTGSTYLQKYTGNSVTATAIAGPYVGSPAVTYKHIAMPVTHDIVLLVWLEPKFTHNTFVYNLKDHISSVVTWDQAGDPSLGSVQIVKTGSHPIP